MLSVVAHASHEALLAHRVRHEVFLCRAHREGALV